LAGCPKFGKRMEHSTNLSKTIASGERRRIAMYACRPSGPVQSHYAYRALPRGEVVERIAEGRYRWTDANTREVHETVRKKRAVRKDRVMPASTCQRCGSTLNSRRVWNRGERKVWSADCPKCGKRWRVDGHGSVVEPAKGRKPGPQGRSQDTFARLTIAADILLTNPDATIYSMAPALFPGQNHEDRRYANARQLFQRNRSQLERERARLKALPGNSRARVVEQAKQRLRST
jgi:hypothetical protein